MENMIKTKENILQNLNIVKYSPGGNPTALVIVDMKKPPKPTLRKLINDLVMRDDPRIEQVGFVNQNVAKPVLQMAGNEFCANAARSAAYYYLNGKTGNIKIKSSGTSRSIEVGITPYNQAYAEVPINPDPYKIKRDFRYKNVFVVKQQGIAHCIVFENDISSLSKNDIVKMSRDYIQNLGLSTYPASGVIYVGMENNNFSILPYVKVKSIGTEVFETACGSGTVALAQVLAFLTIKSIKNLEVKQPSGKFLTVSVDYDILEMKNAQISGAVEIIN